MSRNRNLKKKEVSSHLPKVYYPFLDGFRAIAIFMILAHHIRRGFTLDYLFVSNPPILKWIYYNVYDVFGLNLTSFFKSVEIFISHLKGVLGVEIFFVISGFLITGILMRREINPDNIVHFYERRFFRIYPAYFLMVVISMLFFMLQGQEDLEGGLLITVYHLLFLQNYFPLNSLLAHTWTLVVLEQFYIFSPIIIMIVNLSVKQVSMRRPVFISLCLFFIFLGMFIRWHILSTGQAVFSWPITSTTPYWTISANLGPICFGALLALLEPYWSKWRKNGLWGLLLWMIGVIIFTYLFFEVDWSYYWGGRFNFTCGYLAVGFLFFAAYHGVSIFSRLKLFQWIGKHSYGIYIWHYLVLEFWKIWIGTIPPELIIVLCFISCIAVGVLSTNTIERYFLAMRDKLVPNL